MKTFYVGIKGLVVSEDHVLLLRTNKEDGRGDRWECPGGRIDDDETIEQTLLRELEEELPGIADVKIGQILGARRLHKDIDGEISLTLIYYKVEATLPDPIQLSYEHSEAAWFDVETALKKLEEDDEFIKGMLSRIKADA